MTKSGTRRKSRELALQMLFQMDMGQQTPDHVRLTFWNERKDLDEKVRGFADELFTIAAEREKEIDEIIERNAEHWRMERMAVVDRNVLRIGVAEFIGFPDTPPPVVINEALEIGRRFSTPESVQFINGVLDSVARELGETKGVVRFERTLSPPKAEAGPALQQLMVAPPAALLPYSGWCRASGNNRLSADQERL